MTMSLSILAHRINDEYGIKGRQPSINKLQARYFVMAKLSLNSRLLVMILDLVMPNIDVCVDHCQFWDTELMVDMDLKADNLQ